MGRKAPARPALHASLESRQRWYFAANTRIGKRGTTHRALALQCRRELSTKDAASQAPPRTALQPQTAPTSPRMEVIGRSRAAPLGPRLAGPLQATLSYCPWRMHDVDDRMGGDVTTVRGTCKLVDSKGPHEFGILRAPSGECGRGAVSLYGGAAKTVEHLKLRMKAHLREWNDLGVQAYKKLEWSLFKVRGI